MGFFLLQWRYYRAYTKTHGVNYRFINNRTLVVLSDFRCTVHTEHLETGMVTTNTFEPSTEDPASKPPEKCQWIHDLTVYNPSINSFVWNDIKDELEGKIWHRKKPGHE